MELHLKIPKDKAGQPLLESVIKRGLQDLSPGIFFDVGSRLNMKHPYMDYRQGVYHEDRPEGSKHVCSMDRGGPLGGVIVEVPVWSTITDVVECTWDEVSAQEIMAQEPPFPMPCYHDENKVQVVRTVKNEIILCGWRHTFDRLLRARVPGLTPSKLEQRFSISMRDFVETCDLPEEGRPAFEEDIDRYAPEEGQILEDMGAFEARPTVILPGDSDAGSSGEH